MPIRYGTLRSVNAKLPSWDATGKVELAWKRLDPPTQEELAERLGLKARTNLSHMNRGTMLMSPDYAARIISVVPGLTAADLGAPESVVAVESPGVLDRLQSLEGELAETAENLAKANRALVRLQARVRKLEARPLPAEGSIASQA